MRAKFINEDLKDLLKPKSDEEIEKDLPQWKDIKKFIPKLKRKINKKVTLESDESGWFIVIDVLYLNNLLCEYIIIPLSEKIWIFKINNKSAPSLYTGELNDDMINFINDFLITNVNYES